MKLDNLVFQKKRCSGGLKSRLGFPYIRVRTMKTGKFSKTKIIFGNCQQFYSSNKYCVYAIAGNRLYFMWCGESLDAYKMIKTSASSKCSVFIAVQYNKEVSKFIRDREYIPKLDNECGLYYIEIEN